MEVIISIAGLLQLAFKPSADLCLFSDRILHRTVLYTQLIEMPITRQVSKSKVVSFAFK